MEQKKKVNLQDLLNFQNELLKDNSFHISQNALVKNSLDSVAINYQNINKYNEEYSNNIKQTSAKITDQKNSGRCWIFAALNMIRDKFIVDNNIENFEFSQSYLHFYDKLEKANVFLNQMIDKVDVDTTDRVLFALLNDPVSDGGFFEWAQNLILKYGVVPKTEMEDSFSSANTYTLNKLIDIKLKQALVEIRSNKNSKAIVFEIKEKYLFEIYKILLSAYGTPPKKFNLSLKDKKTNKVKKFYNLTPHTFLKKIKFDFNDYVTIAYTPYKKIKPFQRYELDYANVMQEKGNLIFSTVDKQTFKLFAIAMLYKNKSLWFACDVDHFYNGKKGIWANDLYDYEQFFNIKFETDLSQHIEYRHVATNHAMTLQGFDFDEKEWEKNQKEYFSKLKNKKLNLNDFKDLIDLFPISKWNVENSWGEKRGNKGFFVISNQWFESYVYELVISKKTIIEFLKNPNFLSKKDYVKFKDFSGNNKSKAENFYNELLGNTFNTKPIKLPIWSPFNKNLKG
ncbi:MAG: hypothetical protein K2H11_03710 [Malacoplasma sp.]|nr:hypothetical protein [Malacoplasma sp.]